MWVVIVNCTNKQTDKQTTVAPTVISVCGSFACGFTRLSPSHIDVAVCCKLVEWRF